MLVLVLSIPSYSKASDDIGRAAPREPDHYMMSVFYKLKSSEKYNQVFRVFFENKDDWSVINYNYNGRKKLAVINSISKIVFAEKQTGDSGYVNAELSLLYDSTDGGPISVQIETTQKNIKILFCGYRENNTLISYPLSELSEIVFIYDYLEEKKYLDKTKT